MTALPHDLGPWDDLLQTVPLEELRPALQRALVEQTRQGRPVPRWVRWLGPWTRVKRSPGAWMRKGGEKRFSVSRSGSLWYQHALGIITYDTMHEAMAAEDDYATQRGYLFDPALPPDEAPAAEPAPIPEPTEEAEAARAGTQRRSPVLHQRHAWTASETFRQTGPTSGVWEQTCTHCGRARYRQRIDGGWLYFAARQPVTTGWDRVGGSRLAGQCPRRTP